MEDHGLVITQQGRRFFQQEAAFGAVCKSTHALALGAVRAISLRFLDKPRYSTSTVMASLAKCKAPTCCCQVASACRPLHVASQAASRGRELASLIQAVTRKRKVHSRGSIATKVGRVPRSSVHTWVHEDMCVFSLRGGAGGARIGQPGHERVHCLLRHYRLPAALQVPRPRRRTEKLLQGASGERTIVSRLTHETKFCISF